MEVFNTFPEAVVAGVWELGKIKRGTTRGKVYVGVKSCDVIVDEGTYVATDKSPSAEYENSDTLLYAKPEQMPTLNTAELGAEYVWRNRETKLFYEIREARLGKNQATGEVEHIEFLLRPTEVAVNG